MPTKSAAKKTEPSSAAAVKRTAVAKPKPKPKLPKQRVKQPVAAAAKPVVPPKPATAPAPPRAPRRRPLVSLARRSDGRPLSFVERLSERRHAQFKHAGPVCHSCRLNASQLAAATGFTSR